MGRNLVQRLVVTANVVSSTTSTSPAVEKLAVKESWKRSSLEDLVAKRNAPRAVWLMLPAAITQDTLNELIQYLVTTTS